MKYIAYCRVSTERQGLDGLGMESQINTISNKYEIIKTFKDVATGTTLNREGLKQCLDFAVETGSAIVVASLDRLSRSVEDALAIYTEYNVHIESCKDGAIDYSKIVSLCSLYEWEVTQIRDRVKRALDFKRGKVGEWRKGNYTKEFREMGTAALVKKAKENPNNVKAYCKCIELRRDGWSYQRIANYLNDNRYKTSRGKAFKPMTVLRLIKLNIQNTHQ